MQIYSDDFGCVIWLTVNSKEIRVDLQDLAPDFEYERSVSTSEVDAVCQALEINFQELKGKLLLMLEHQMTAIDLFKEFLENNEIYFSYYSGSR